MAKATVIRYAELAASAWKNGGGVTREVTVDPPGAEFDAFAWRVSIADVTQEGPFSKFDGVDRTLVLLAGAGMRLDQPNGISQELLEPLDVLCFEGESQVNATLINGATRDFNLMVRRSRARADLKVQGDGEYAVVEADMLLLFCALGAIDVALSTGDLHTLSVCDTLRIVAPRDLTYTLRSNGGAMLAIRLHHTSI